jgi:hypothetical protein
VIGEPVRVIVLDWDEFEEDPDKVKMEAWPVQSGVAAFAPETRAAYERLLQPVQRMIPPEETLA